MIVDISALPPDVTDALAKQVRTEFHEKAQQAIREQQRMADHFDRHRPRAINGLGGRTMALHPFLHWEAGQYFKDGDWDRDPDKVKWYLKQNPAAKVRSAGTRIQVGYSGPSELPPNKRSTQSFG